MPHVSEERSVGELFGQLTQDMGLLVRQEVKLAKTEMSEKISRTAGSVASIGVGVFIAYIGALAISAAVILGLVQIGLAPWLAALIIGLILAAAGYAMLQGALQNLRRTNLAPTRTIETLKDDVQWAKEQRP